MQARILVTGASGFVGKALTAVFQEMPEAVGIQVITAGRKNNLDVKLELQDTGTFRRIIKDVMPTAVVHLGAIASPIEAKSSPRIAWDVNFTATVELAAAVLAEAPNCVFVSAGSSEVYGASFRDRAGAIDEECLLKPQSLYGATKAAADVALGQMYHDGLRSIRFRPFNHTGAGQSPSFVVPAFAQQLAKIKIGVAAPKLKVGNMDAVRDFLDVRDVVRAYAGAALGSNRDAEGIAFNLSSGRGTSIREIFDILRGLADVTVSLEMDPERIRASEIPVAVGSAKSAKLVLGWSPVIPLTETLKTVLEYWITQEKEVSQA